MSLREEIEAAIKMDPSDPATAALTVCLLLERRLDLAGNGWFDDDETVRKALGLDDEDE
jgi:hypothetical protein